MLDLPRSLQWANGIPEGPAARSRPEENARAKAARLAAKTVRKAAQAAQERALKAYRESGEAQPVKQPRSAAQ